MKQNLESDSIVGADSDSGVDSHSFNFEFLFTILNFRLNITITFCLDQSGAKLSEYWSATGRLFARSGSINFIISEFIPGNSDWFDRTTLS